MPEIKDRLTLAIKAFSENTWCDSNDDRLFPQVFNMIILQSSRTAQNHTKKAIMYPT